MAHDGYPSIQDELDGIQDLNAALQLEGIHPTLLHDADGILHRLGGIDLIGAERHVADDHGALDATSHTAGMVYHLIYSDGERRQVACHHIAGTVTDQDDVHPRLVHYLSHRIVIRGKHCYLAPLLLHFYKTVGRYLTLVFNQISCHNRVNFILNLYYVIELFAFRNSYLAAKVRLLGQRTKTSSQK